MAGRIVWGVLLILIGAALVVFNKPYAERTAGLVRVTGALGDRPRLMTVLVGLMMIAAGVSVLVSPH